MPKSCFLGSCAYKPCQRADKTHRTLLPPIQEIYCKSLKPARHPCLA
jgi:hypothetical protein